MLNLIGYYQFDNLIQNRVPFVFLNIGSHVIDWYQHIYKSHLETYQVNVDFSSILPTLQSKNIPKDYAIVLLCLDGKTSSQAYEVLTKNLYTNVYVINGGYQQMVTERE